MKRFGVLVSLFIMLALVPQGFAGTMAEIKERGVLKVGMEPGYMPFELTNKRGEIIGFDVDMAKRMAKALGVKLELVSTAWDGIIPALMTSKFDIVMSGMTITKKRAEAIDFSDPYIAMGQTILLNKKLEGIVKSYKDLNFKKYSVASKLGTTGEIATKKMIPNANYISFETEQEGVMELLNGKVDAFVYDSPFNAVAYAEKGRGKVIFLDKSFTDESAGWAIRKGNPDFMVFLNKFLAEQKSNGAYTKIYTKWFLDDAWLKEIQ